MATLGTLVVSNVMANQVLPSWAYVPWNCGVAAVLVVIAVRFDHLTADELGLSTRQLPRGIRWGAVVSGGIVAVYLLGLAIPATRELFRDDRVRIDLGPMLWQALVMVPLGTVLLEEIAFRGVLPAMLRRRFAPASEGTSRWNGALRADVVAALCFGLWHVLPSWNVNEANPVFRDALGGGTGRAVTVTGAVLGTAVAGLGLSWLRNRSGSLAAPVLVHCTTNGLGYVLSWLVHQN